MELKDTVEGMESPDYKERFKAEYYQTKIRYEKLKKLLNKMNASEFSNNFEDFVGFPVSCSEEILSRQLFYMEEYLHCLEIRAVVEHIEL